MKYTKEEDHFYEKQKQDQNYGLYHFVHYQHIAAACRSRIGKKPAGLRQ